MSSDGAPRNIEGMKSRKVWVIAIEMMKIRRMFVESSEMRAIERIDIATRLMWMPGIRPVIVPARVPRRRGIRFSIGGLNLVLFLRIVVVFGVL